MLHAIMVLFDISKLPSLDLKIVIFKQKLLSNFATLIELETNMHLLLQNNYSIFFKYLI